MRRVFIQRKSWKLGNRGVNVCDRLLSTSSMWKVSMLVSIGFSKKEIAKTTALIIDTLIIE